jgi:CRP-like cAMP-binding protein
MPFDGENLLKQVSLFANLPAAELSGLSKHLTRRTFRRATMIFHKDQAGDTLYIIESGRVRIFLAAEGGEELTLREHGAGEGFGELALLDGAPRSASAEAIEDTVTYTLNRIEFQRYLVEAPQLSLALIKLLSSRMRELTDYAESLAFLNLEARLARELLQLGERHGVPTDGLEIDRELTQTQLASMIGATRERVNRALKTFRSQRLIEFRGKKIAIIDRERLKKLIY